MTEVFENVYAQYGIIGVVLVGAVVVIWKLYSANQTANDKMLELMKENIEVYKDSLTKVVENIGDKIDKIADKLDVD